MPITRDYADKNMTGKQWTVERHIQRAIDDRNFIELQQLVDHLRNGLLLGFRFVYRADTVAHGSDLSPQPKHRSGDWMQDVNYQKDLPEDENGVSEPGDTMVVTGLFYEEDKGRKGRILDRN